MRFFWMSLGGVLGVMTRYLVGGGVHRVLGLGFPYGTFIVNASGCFLIGFLAALGKTSWQISANEKAFLFIGFLGAYTTFSTYMLESYELATQEQWLVAIFYLFGSVLCGAVAFLLGVWFAR